MPSIKKQIQNIDNPDTLRQLIECLNDQLNDIAMLASRDGRTSYDDLVTLQSKYWRKWDQIIQDWKDTKNGEAQRP
jgi:hypothetical protein